MTADSSRLTLQPMLLATRRSVAVVLPKHRSERFLSVFQITDPATLFRLCSELLNVIPIAITTAALLEK